jgi:hypothetical protein
MEEQTEAPPKKVEFTDDFIFLGGHYNMTFPKGHKGSVKAEHADAAIKAGKAVLIGAATESAADPSKAKDGK